MDLMMLIKVRRSVRSYTDKQVEKPMVEALIRLPSRHPVVCFICPGFLWSFRIGIYSRSIRAVSKRLCCRH